MKQKNNQHRRVKMKEKTDEEELKKELKGNLPVFKSVTQIKNMRKERFVVPQATTFEITQKVVLTEEKQKETVFKLVDRKPEWLDLTEEQQKEEIKAVLLLQTVAEYLYSKNHISEDCTMFENGFDKDGNVVLDAFYIKDSKLQRKLRAQFEKKESEKEGTVISLADYQKEDN